jgi:hypothetical protein
MVIVVSTARDVIDAVSVAVGDGAEIVVLATIDGIQALIPRAGASAIVIDLRECGRLPACAVVTQLPKQLRHSLVVLFDPRDLSIALDFAARGVRYCLPVPVPAVQLRRCLRRALAGRPD